MTPIKAIELLRGNKKITRDQAIQAVNMAYQEGLTARRKIVSDPQSEEDRIWKAVEGFSKISKEEIIAFSRKEELMDIRRITSFEMYRVFSSQNVVGRIMKRDHTSILNHLKKYRDLFTTDRNFRVLAIKISNLINGE